MLTKRLFSFVVLSVLLGTLVLWVAPMASGQEPPPQTPGSATPTPTPTAESESILPDIPGYKCVEDEETGDITCYGGVEPDDDGIVIIPDSCEWVPPGDYVCTETITISGLVSRIDEGQSDDFTVTIGNLDAGVTYKIEVVDFSGDGHFAFNSSCTDDSDSSGNFTATSSNREFSADFTLYGCVGTHGSRETVQGRMHRSDVLELGVNDLVKVRGEPDPPENLDPDAQSASQIDVSWDSTSGADKYQLQRKTGSGGTWGTISSTLTGTEYEDMGLICDTTYYYQVRAHGDGGDDYMPVWGDYSDEESETTEDCPLTVSFLSSSYSADEGSDPMITVRLSAALSSAVDIPVIVTGGTAGLDDYDIEGLNNGTLNLTFNAGQTSKDFTVDTDEDDGDCDDETLTFGFGTLPAGISKGVPSTTKLTIEDDEICVSFSSSSYTVTEGSERRITVELSSAPGSTKKIPITVTRRSAESSDYDVEGLDSSGRLTFSATQTSKYFTIDTNEDNSDCNNETIDLGFGSLPSGVIEGEDSEAVLTINDDDTCPIEVSFNLSSYTVNEGSGRSVEVRLNPGPGNSVTIPVKVTHGSSEPGDYSVTNMIGNTLNLTFSAGDTSEHFTITANQDTDRDDETVNLGFGTLPPGVIKGSRSSATLTINDDDPPCTITPCPIPLAGQSDLWTVPSGVSNVYLDVGFSAGSGLDAGAGDIEVLWYRPEDSSYTTPAGSLIVDEAADDGLLSGAGAGWQIRVAAAADAFSSDAAQVTLSFRSGTSSSGTELALALVQTEPRPAAPVNGTASANVTTEVLTLRWSSGSHDSRANPDHYRLQIPDPFSPTPATLYAAASISDAADPVEHAIADARSLGLSGTHTAFVRHCTAAGGCSDPLEFQVTMTVPGVAPTLGVDSSDATTMEVSYTLPSTHLHYWLQLLWSGTGTGLLDYNTLFSPLSISPSSSSRTFSRPEDGGSFHAEIITCNHSDRTHSATQCQTRRSGTPLHKLATVDADTVDVIPLPIEVDSPLAPGSVMRRMAQLQWDTVPGADVEYVLEGRGRNNNTSWNTVRSGVVIGSSEATYRINLEDMLVDHDKYQYRIRAFDSQSTPTRLSSNYTDTLISIVDSPIERLNGDSTDQNEEIGEAIVTWSPPSDVQSMSLRYRRLLPLNGADHTEDTWRLNIDSLPSSYTSEVHSSSPSNSEFGLSGLVLEELYAIQQNYKVPGEYVFAARDRYVWPSKRRADGGERVANIPLTNQLSAKTFSYYVCTDTFEDATGSASKANNWEDLIVHAFSQWQTATDGLITMDHKGDGCADFTVFVDEIETSVTAAFPGDLSKQDIEEVRAHIENLLEQFRSGNLLPHSNYAATVLADRLRSEVLMMDDSDQFMIELVEMDIFGDFAGDIGLIDCGFGIKKKVVGGVETPFISGPNACALYDSHWGSSDILFRKTPFAIYPLTARAGRLNKCITSPRGPYAYEVAVHEAGHALGINGTKRLSVVVDPDDKLRGHSALPESVMNYESTLPEYMISSGVWVTEPDCSPQPFDILAIYALYQTVD